MKLLGAQLLFALENGVTPQETAIIHFLKVCTFKHLHFYFKSIVVDYRGKMLNIVSLSK